MIGRLRQWNASCQGFKTRWWLRKERFWVVTKSGSFSVKSLIFILKEVQVSHFPTSIVWNVWVLPKVFFFFAWEATWGKVLTLNRLQRRWRSLANRCSLYYAYEKSVDHTLLHCGKARLLWELLFSLFKVCLVIQAFIRETFLRWQGSFIGRKRKKVWRATSLCLFWTIWKERNKRSFENMELSIQRFKFLFLCSLLSWTNMLIEHTSMSLVDFIDWLGTNLGGCCMHCVLWCAPF